MKKYVVKYNEGLSYELYSYFVEDYKYSDFEEWEQWRIDEIDQFGRITAVTLKLDFKSKLVNWFAKSWPITGVIKGFFVRNGTLCIHFMDHITQERHMYPFGLDKESEWLASFNVSRRIWSLKRLKYVV